MTISKRKKFSMRHFRSLTSGEEIVTYAQTHLSCLGKGSSRIVFACSKSKVLKIAINEKGYAQNAAELFVSHNAETKGAVSAIMDSRKDEAGNVVWLISQLVRTVTSSDEFKALSGFSWDVYGDTIKAFAKTNAQNDLESITSDISNQYSKRLVRLKNEGDERNAKYYETLLFELDLMKNSSFFKGIVSAMKVNRLMPGDILEIDHYGKTSDGAIVLYDYGFTEEIAKRFYPTKTQETAKVYSLNRGNLLTNSGLKTIPLKKKAG